MAFLVLFLLSFTICSFAIQNDTHVYTIPPDATITSWPSGETGSFFTSDSSSLCLAVTVVPDCPENATITYGSDCWSNWNSYWTASVSSTNLGVCTSFINTVCTRFYPVTFTSSSFGVTTDHDKQGTETIVVTETDIISDGAFPVATSTQTFTQFLTGDETLTTKTVYKTITGLYTSITTVATTVKTDAAITPPPCTLPSVAPQCQSSWESYIQTTNVANLTQPTCQDYDTNPQCASSYASYQQASNSGDWWGAMLSAYQNNWQHENFGPLCTQASVGGAICSSIQDRWSRAVGAGNVTDWITTTEHPNLSSALVTSVWPSSFSYAPGCTVGCSACHITGGSVKLLYWPATSGQVTTASDLLVTAVVGDTTLTSPTVYISFQEVYASDSCSAIGGTYTNTIVPLSNPADLSSLWGYDFTNTQHLYTASFNYADLASPVPDSIYNSQPRCAQSANLFSQTAKPGDEFVCPRILPYEPILSIPPEIRSLDPAWSQCQGGIQGIYDPPSALQRQTVAAQPTLPPEMMTSKASPASSVSAGMPTPTAPPAKSTPAASTPSAVGDNLPSKSSPERPSSTGKDATPTSQNIGAIIASVLGLSSPAQHSNAHPATPPVPGASTSLSPPREHSVIASISGLEVHADPSNPSAIIIAAVTTPTDPHAPTQASPPPDHTLAIGGAPVTIGSTIFSLGSTAIILGTGSQASTIPFSAATTPPTSPDAPIAVLTAGSQILTLSRVLDVSSAVSGEEVIVASTTLAIGGPAVTLSGGHRLTLASDGSLVEDGTHTLAWSTGLVSASASASMTTSSVSSLSLLASSASQTLTSNAVGPSGSSASTFEAAPASTTSRSAAAETRLTGTGLGMLFVGGLLAVVGLL